MDNHTENGYSSDLGIDPKDEYANGLQAFAIVGEVLEEDGWFPQQLDDKYIYSMSYNGKNGTLRCYAQVRVDLEQFVFYVVAPVKVPPASLAIASEYITRANYGMRIGNFELDYSDGEVRYKSSFDFEGGTLNPEFIKHAIYPAVETLDRYLPGLLGVIYGGKTAEEAIVEIETSGE